MHYESGKMKIEKVVKDAFGNDLPIKIVNLKAWKCYIVDVKFNKQNVAHRAIMFTKGFVLKDKWKLDDYIELHSQGYEAGRIEERLSHIYYLKVIKEIPQMSETPAY